MDEPERKPDQGIDLPAAITYIDFVNITHLTTTFEALKKARTPTFFVEHSTLPKYQAARVKSAQAAGQKMWLGPLDPEQQAVGGVGYIAPSNHCLKRAEPLSERFTKATKLGRAEKFLCCF